MRSFRTRVLGATLLTLAFVATACGGSGEGTAEQTPDTDTTAPGGGEATSEPGGSQATGGTQAPPEGGPVISVGSFAFAESEILAEIYAQVLQANGYTVEKQLNLGAREVIYPELEEGGSINFLPEYVGSALGVGFGQAELPTDPEEGAQQLAAAFEEQGVTVLEPAPGEDTNVFVMTAEKAQEFGVTAIGDLANVDQTILFGGPSECEGRITCYVGLTGTYGLTNVEFQAIDDGATRIESLKNDDIQLALLFSTQPVIEAEGFVVLEDPENIAPAENIIPVVRDEVVEAYGADFTNLVNGVSELITTEVLLDLVGRVEVDLEDAEAVAADFISENGLA